MMHLFNFNWGIILYQSDPPHTTNQVTVYNVVPVGRKYKCHTCHDDAGTSTIRQRFLMLKV